MEFFFNTPAVVDSDRILYTASSFARSSLLYLQETGRLQALKPHTSSRSNLASYLFFLVNRGEGILEYDGREYSLSGGSCVFIDCRKPYSHSTGEGGKDGLWSIQWCHFNGPTLASIYEKYCERGGRPVFAPEDSAPIEAALSLLLSTAKSSDYMRDMKINSLLSELMVFIMSESWHPEERLAAPKRNSITDVKNYLDQHYHEKITLDELASGFYIDKYYLIKSFRARFGMNISAYLQSVRITHAKHMLRFSDKTVEEIGYETGIGSPAYFSRVFKNVEGVSPKQYREQW